MIEVANVRMPLDAGLPEHEALVRSCIANTLGISVDAIDTFELLRRSVDARKNGVRFVAKFAVALHDAACEKRLLAEHADVRAYEPYVPFEIAQLNTPVEGERPVVVGTGPAGLFAALYLARAGLRPIVLERGGAIEERMHAVEAFDGGSPLDFSTNIQFGEGGAGTFSDGKLTTGIKSPLASHVLHWFVDAGAPAEILWQAKPHIGTDNLVAIVRAMRTQIEELGGEVRFHAQLTGVHFDESGRLCAVDVSEGGRPALTCECTHLVLACGHSARDTFRMLQRAGFAMEPKPFSVGVRIEHLQADIDKAQYGKDAGHPALGAADYKMAVHLPNGRSVYTFCMCPGGRVVCAASEDYGVVVNGMSVFARDAENANAALLVGVTPDDFKSEDPLAGVRFQRRIEQAAFGEAHEMGGDPWQAPAQTVRDFMHEGAGHASRKVKPSYARGVVWCDLHEVLPEFVTDALEEALPLLDRKLKGFADPEAVLTGVETRSSSPVRILRDAETLQAGAATGVYPAGEGAGYAGGIMSAAVDGLRCARALAEDIALKQAAEALRTGEAAIFPTDTVYGLGLSAEHAATPQKLYDIKQRDAGKPIAWLVDSPDALQIYGEDVPPEALELARAHWPGALTLIVKASSRVPAAFQSVEGTIGLRMPDCAATLRLIRAVGNPLATTSANISGGEDPRCEAEVASELRERAAAFVPYSGQIEGLASTVVDCTQGSLRVLRQGSVRI